MHHKNECIRCSYDRLDVLYALIPNLDIIRVELVDFNKPDPEEQAEDQGKELPPKLPPIKKAMKVIDKFFEKILHIVAHLTLTIYTQDAVYNFDRYEKSIDITVRYPGQYASFVCNKRTRTNEDREDYAGRTEVIATGQPGKKMHDLIKLLEEDDIVKSKYNYHLNNCIINAQYVFDKLTGKRNFLFPFLRPFRFLSSL